MFVAINLAGPVHTVVTVTGTSTDGVNSTVQISVTEPPAVMIPDGLVMLTTGAGTAIIMCMHEKRNCYVIALHTAGSISMQ